MSLKKEVHGSLQSILPDIWVVQGGTKLPVPIPVRITKTMTIVRNPETNELTLINAMRVSDELLTEIEGLGTIKHIITIGAGHGKDDLFYRERFGARIYDVEGHSYVRKLAPASETNEVYMEADVHLTETSELPLQGAKLKVIHADGAPEGVLCLENEGGTLVTGDSLQNMSEPDGYVNFFGKLIMKKGGFFKPYNVGPAWLDKTNPPAEDIKSIFLDSEYESVIPGHGNPVVGRAKEKYRPAVEAALRQLENN